MLGGTVNIKTRQGAGTSIILSLPLSAMGQENGVVTDERATPKV
jgi:hypothetical protein